ncbi:hypothetical protein PVAND_002681 [Polypedilum vanderplanki]|uniref:RecA family profile 1 domain-containing protein n=1 Tax=Polypedilum vanderplanki TaxID=319348 RepID=A0A9J6BSV9_POLVA|nr:hypothetical protein PVAND_002681 [Polypedilum vanderplanki]
MTSSSSNKSSQDNVIFSDDDSLQLFIRESELQETSFKENDKIIEDEEILRNEKNHNPRKRKFEVPLELNDEELPFKFDAERLFFSESNEEIEKNSITTGSRTIDKLLEGGIEVGSITELFGESRTGKTQFVHTLAVTCQLPIDSGGGGGKCLFIDTEGTFRPERLLTIAQRFGMNPEEVLDNVHYVRVYNTEHQKKILDKARSLMLQNQFALIVVDCVTSLYRTDFPEVEEILIRHKHLKSFLRRLQNLIYEYNIAAVVTNQISSYPKGPTKTITKPFANSTIGHSSTTRLYLKNYLNNTRICQIYSSPSLPECSVFYSINNGGITDAKDN